VRENVQVTLLYTHIELSYARGTENKPNQNPNQCTHGVAATGVRGVRYSIVGRRETWSVAASGEQHQEEHATVACHAGTNATDLNVHHTACAITSTGR
jgi:hypothetical protein